MTSLGQMKVKDKDSDVATVLVPGLFFVPVGGNIDFCFVW